MSDSQKLSLRARYKALRKQLLSFTPVIRRSRHERALARLQRRIDFERAANEGMGSLFFSPPPPAASARCVLPIPIRTAPTDELCLFVTHVAKPELKPHVIDHVSALIDAGVPVLLIANSDVAPAELQIPPALASKLSGLLVRENVGFDFGAWGHAYGLIDPQLVRRRLYLVNDSIIGPLDLGAYRELLAQIRSSTADIVGLTSNPDPHPHLQSFYLVFNERFLHSDACNSFMRGIVNMPLKQNVVDCYEIWLTPSLEKRGFSVASIFPNFSRLPPPKRNDTLCAWRELLAAGFPFIKSIVIKDPVEGEASRRLLPERYL